MGSCCEMDNQIFRDLFRELYPRIEKSPARSLIVTDGNRLYAKGHMTKPENKTTHFRFFNG